MKKQKKRAKKAVVPAKQAKPCLKNLLEIIRPEDMRVFSSVYLDPLEDGFKISIWSGKDGLIEGFVPEKEMPPFVRKILVKRTESLRPGERIEIIGKSEEEMASIASEPIDAQANGNLVAEVTKKPGEVHLRITLEREIVHSALQLGAEELGVSIDHLANMVNTEVGKHSGTPEYEKEAVKLIGVMREAKKLKKNPGDKKTIQNVYRASCSMSSLSKKYGFARISQLADSMAVLFKEYTENGKADPAAIPIIWQTVEMMEKMTQELAFGPDVDSLVSKISRKDEG